MEGDVTVRVTHSTVNYKDGLAITGKAPVVRRWPMIPGIDFSGRGRKLLASGLEAGRQGRAQRHGAPARRIWAPMPRRAASRATGWCRCPTA